MSIAIGIDEGIASLVLDHDLDQTSAEEFRLAAEASLTDLVHTLRIDLSRVRQMDSSGISALVAIRYKANQGRHVVVLIDPTPKVRRLLESSGMTQIFQVF